MASAFTPEQIDHYLDYIAIPPAFRRPAKPACNLDFLVALHVYHISAIPYENLALHYSKEHSISLEPQALFKKLTKSGRGGYCMENSIFFSHVLRALGFKVYMVGARIRLRKDGVPQGDYIGWVHMVNIVTLSDGAKYMVDVCFGGDGATKPLLLKDGHVTPNIGSQELRLIYSTIPGQTDESEKLWIYQYRNAPDRPWNAFYCFPEMEFLQADFEVMNWYTSCHPDSFQRYTVLVVKFLRRETEIYGKVMLVDGLVKLNTGGKTSVVKTCTTEEERIEALNQWFGIVLTSAEREGISGMSTELR